MFGFQSFIRIHEKLTCSSDVCVEFKNDVTREQQAYKSINIHPKRGLVEQKLHNKLAVIHLPQEAVPAVKT